MKLEKQRRLRWKDILMCKIMYNRIGQLLYSFKIFSAHQKEFVLSHITS